MSVALKTYVNVLKGNVGVMVLSWILFGIGSGLVYPYFSLYVKFLGGTDFDIGLVSSIGSLAGLLVMIPGGYLTDVYGRRRVIVWGTWMIVMLDFLYAIVTDWRFLLLVYMLDSILHFYTPALMTIIADSLPEYLRAGGLALTEVLTELPWFIVPPIGGVLVDKYGVLGLRIGYLVAGICGVLAAILRMKLLKETLRETKKEQKLFEVLAVSFRETFSAVKKVPMQIALILIESILVSSPSIVVFHVYGVVYAKEYLGISMGEWGLYSSFSSMASTVAGVLLAKVLDKAERRFFIAVGACLAAVSYFSLCYALSAIVVCFSLIVFRVAGTMYISSWSAYLIDLVEEELRGRIYALAQISSSLGYTWASIVLGYLYSLNPRDSLNLSAVLALVDAVILFIVVKPVVKKPNN